MSDNTPTLADYARRMRSLVEEDVRIIRQLNAICMEAWSKGQLTKAWALLAPEFPGCKLHYFLQARATGDIKIGKSSNLERRFRNIFHSNSRGVVMIACYPTVFEHEKELLGEYRDGRLCGEWHSPTVELTGYLRLIGAQFDDPDGATPFGEPKDGTRQHALLPRFDKDREFWA